MSAGAMIVGTGLHPFGRHEASGLAQGVHAARAALADAGIGWEEIEVAFGGSSAAGNADTMVAELGLTGVPFVNVANGCATGGSALYAAAAAIAAGQAGLALAVGFDKHPRGAFDPRPAEWGLPDWYGEAGLMLTTQFFALKLRRYMELFGISERALGLVAEKAFAHAEHAPHAWRRQPVGLETIMASPLVNDPLRKFMFCSPAEGGAAVVLASPARARRLGRAGVALRAVALRTRPRGSFEVFSPSLEPERGPSPTVLAARACFEAAGVAPAELHLAQLQDTESGAEIMHMAETGLCADGEQEAWLAEGRTRLGGALPVNTDGGCLACGEPIGASGLRQLVENVRQLEGRAGPRQVAGARLAFSQVYGAPGVAACAIVERLEGRA